MTSFRAIVGYFIAALFFVGIIPAIVWLIACLLPHPNNDIAYTSPIRLIAVPFFITGATFIIWSNAFLVIRGKGGPAEGFGVEVTPKTQRLVTTGAYHYSRNPMVFGAFCLYASVALYMLSIIALICLALFYCWVKRYLRKWEEPRLLKDFGNEYAEYKKKTAMIIPHFYSRKHINATEGK
jgi:protein-S-isoprenylcysteine O-methyltransferase Ste14